MVNHEDLLDTVVSRMNAWAMSGNFADLLGMFHDKGHLHIHGIHGNLRFPKNPKDPAESIEAFLQANRPTDTIESTYSVDTGAGAQNSYRWSRQAETLDAGNIAIEVQDGRIILMIWEFLVTTQHPIPLAVAQLAKPQAAAPAPTPGGLQPGFRPMAPSQPASQTASPASPQSQPPATPSAPAVKPESNKPVFL